MPLHVLAFASLPLVVALAYLLRLLLRLESVPIPWWSALAIGALAVTALWLMTLINLYTGALLHLIFCGLVPGC
ncbi:MULTISPECIES: hypothetical protein [Amycolatopsis]|uniref:Uncharacterized protein n=1 Tax=Amycolatopsis saalfeldensis TaxID=394193 RepID=A0A1H8YQJ1_9PSEU|nr:MULTISPECIES: hypothetical protein [Amycolatopsis]SEP54450.1 hypothetical protein SAMN04489732_14726 [Amycolatopsis saalfeldensis]